MYDFELSADEMARLDALDQGDAGAISWVRMAGLESHAHFRRTQ